MSPVNRWSAWPIKWIKGGSILPPGTWVIGGLVFVNVLLFLYFFVYSMNVTVNPGQGPILKDFPEPEEYFILEAQPSSGPAISGADSLPLPDRYQRLASGGLIGSSRPDSPPDGISDPSGPVAPSDPPPVEGWDLTGWVRSRTRVLAVLKGPRGRVYPVALRDRIPGTDIHVTRIGRESVDLRAPGHRSTRINLREGINVMSTGRTLTITGPGDELP